MLLALFANFVATSQQDFYWDGEETHCLLHTNTLSPTLVSFYSILNFVDGWILFDHEFCERMDIIFCGLGLRPPDPMHSGGGEGEEANTGHLQNSVN